MSIGYNVRTNNLTSPPSYRCEAVAASIVEEDGIAALINVYNPSITAATAATVLAAFRAVVKQELLGGRSVKIENFVSFVNTLPAKLDLPTDPLPDGVLNVSAKVSPTLKTEMRQDATFNRIGYPVKAPTIIANWDTNYDINGWIRPGEPIKISGQDLAFDQTDTEQGVFLRQVTASLPVDTRQTSIAQNTPGSVIIVPNFTPTVYNDMRIIVRTRYTPNGELREGFGKTRSTNEQLALFRVVNLTTPASYAAYTGVPTETMVKFVAEYSSDNKFYLSVGYLTGEMGAKVQVAAAGAYNLPGLGTDIVVIVPNMITFGQRLITAGRYIQDVTELQTV